MTSQNHRDTIHEEEAEVVIHQPFEGKQFYLQVKAPQIAAFATPGSFVQIRCDASLPLRRPLSIMKTNPGNGTVDFIYKVVGTGTQLLSKQKVGATLTMLGPIGQPFTLDPKFSRPLLIGGGVGIPPMVFLSDLLRKQRKHYDPLVIMGSEVPFPFTAAPSQYIVPGLPDGVIAAMPLLEDWGITSRLTTLQNYPGCFDGYVTELAKIWLDSLPPEQLQKVSIFSCGPHPMLAAVTNLAKEYQLPIQVSLEEFMACGVGGCAGCTVTIQTPQGPAMKRVCVDGPVFNGNDVVF